MVRSSMVVVGALVLTLLGSSVAAARSPRQPVGDAVAVPPGGRDLGPARGGRTLRLTVALKPRDADALYRFAAAASTPGSARYGRFLATGQFAKRFGATRTTVASVRAALRRAGMHPGRLRRNGLTIPVTATVDQAERTFGTVLRRVSLPGGRLAVVNTRTPTLPAPLAEHVQAVFGLDTLPVRAVAHHQARSELTAITPCPAARAAAQSNTPAPWTFDQLTTAYDFTRVRAAGGTGRGTTVALMEWEPHKPGDIAAFGKCYGISTPVFSVPVSGGPGTDVDDIEATMDIEIVAALAPETRILVYAGPPSSTSQHYIDVYERIASDNYADVVSTSWGLCEQLVSEWTAAHEAIVLAQMAAQGQSVLASAGDLGSADCAGWNDSPPGWSYTELAVDDPGSQPWSTSVGGTSMTAIGAPPATPPTETTWNAGGPGEYAGGGGGGISGVFPMPSWQTGPGVVNSLSSGGPCAVTSGLCRQVPDVSALANPSQGYLFYYTGGGGFGSGWVIEGGTSASAPLWAAMIASVRSAPACRGRRFGLLNPALYQLAAGSGSGAFNDITVGTNDVLDLNNGLYPATAGYDMATGLGSPIGGGLLAGMCPPAG